MIDILADKRTLIVEDSPTQALALGVLLEDAGMPVEIAASAEAAIETIARSRFDLVLSDVVMPGMSGYDLCRRLKSFDTTRNIPFVLVTSLGDPLEIMRALECGADNFVTKPYEAQALLARVTRVLEVHGERARHVRNGSIDVTVLGAHFRIAADKEQILDLLISNFEDVVRANGDLRLARSEAEDARGKAEEANKSKSDFLAMMSHDLRTPLNAIGGYADLLLMGLRGDVNDAQQKDLGRIRSNQQHLLQLVNDVLNFARIERGDIPLKLERALLNDIVRPLGAMIEPQVMARTITYRHECADGSAFVRVDRERMEQIVINLLTNATKFTRFGGEIVMRCGRDAMGGAFVSVQDTGIGIPSELLAAIFDPFVQVDQSSVGTREGVGLGLAISRQLTTLMGGTIAVMSVLGEGSTFTVTLPVVE